MIKHVCVFCGSRGEVDPAYRQAATDVGAFLADEGLVLVYGGGRLGLMGLTAEAAMQKNGHVIGVIPEHLDEREGAFHKATELYIVDSMHTRKMEMSERADAFVILPGGFGTMDEFFEILTWRQIGLHNKPIFVLNIKDYWTPLKDLFDHIIGAGFADDVHRTYVHFCESVDELRRAVMQQAASMSTDHAKM